MGVSPSNCIDCECRSKEESGPLAKQIEEALLANENFRRRIGELESTLQHENMKYGSLQREHAALATEKEELMKRASTIEVVPTADAATVKTAAELQEAIKEKNALAAANSAMMKQASDLLAQLQSSDATVVSLQQQVKDMQGQLANAGDITATSRQLADLEAQLNSERANAAAARKLLEEHEARTAAQEARKQQIIQNVAEVNGYLKKFASDADFQAKLKSPKVSIALDLWGGSASHAVLTDAQLLEIKQDPGVQLLFPPMKELEAACTRANIFFPIEYVRAGRSELDAAALVRMYGTTA